jgi:4-hydroxy-4-methyl-2-oxoglutarate aldolase
MNSAKERIIHIVRRNRISTCEVSDALGKTGVLSGVNALNTGHSVSGPVRYVYAYNKSNWELHEQLEQVKTGEIIVVDAIDCDDFAVFGSLVSKFCILYREVAAMVVLGLVRDVHYLKKENYPIWCKGTTPLGCFNTPNEILPSDTIIGQRRAAFENAIAVCDDSGVSIIPEKWINESFISKLELMELQEDAWFHSIDTDRCTTYETVCQKRYLEEGSVFHKYDILKEEVP